MKHVILLLLGVFLFVLSFTLKEIFPIGLIFTAVGTYLIVQNAGAAWKYWKTTDPNYVPPANHGQNYESHFTYDRPKSYMTKLGPKKQTTRQPRPFHEESLEEMLERLEIKYNIKSKDKNE